MIRFPDYPSRDVRTWFEVDGFAYVGGDSPEHLERVSLDADPEASDLLTADTILHALALADGFPEHGYVHWVEKAAERVEVAVVRLTVHRLYCRSRGAAEKYDKILLQTWERQWRNRVVSLVDQLGGDPVADRAAKILKEAGVQSVDDLVADYHRLGADEFENGLLDLPGFGGVSWKRVRSVMAVRGCDL